MAHFALPNSLNYDEGLPTLPPQVQNFTQVVYPTNGSTFFPSQNIIVDIPSRGCIDPQSIYIRYKMNLGAGGTALATFVPGCPVYTPIQRVDTYINSQIVDSVNEYNVTAHMWSNIFLGCSEKYGFMSSFGYFNNATDPGTMTTLDGRTVAAAINTATSYSVAAPLVCTKLATCDKMFPAFATGGIRLSFTLDTLATWLGSATNADPAKCFISNFEVCYDLIDMGSEFERDVLSKPSIMIKSSGYNNSSVAVPTGTSGIQTYVFNQRFASIRSAILLPASAVAAGNQVNGKFDAIDVSNNGSYSLNIGGVSYPQGGPINFTLNRSGALCELRKAVGTLYDWSKSMAISDAEFGYLDNTGQTTSIAPGKVYVGFSLDKINSSSNNLMNGTSTQNSPINAVVQIVGTGVAGNAKQLYLILNYDCVFSIDPRTKMVTMIQ